MTIFEEYKEWLDESRGDGDGPHGAHKYTRGVKKPTPRGMDVKRTTEFMRTTYTHDGSSSAKKLVSKLQAARDMENDEDDDFHPTELSPAQKRFQRPLDADLIGGSNRRYEKKARPIVRRSQERDKKYPHNDRSNASYDSERISPDDGPARKARFNNVVYRSTIHDKKTGETFHHIETTGSGGRRNVHISKVKHIKAD